MCAHPPALSVMIEQGIFLAGFGFFFLSTKKNASLCNISWKNCVYMSKDTDMNENEKILATARKAAAGDRAACEAFVEQMGGHVFRLVRRIVDNALDAEELVQDILLSALSGLEKYDPERAPFGVWIRQKAYSMALNHRRKPTLQVVSYDGELSAADEAELQVLFQESSQERTELLKNALKQLSEEEQTLVVLFYYDDLSLGDISYILSATPGTLAVRLHRIRQKLYHIIQKQQKI